MPKEAKPVVHVFCYITYEGFTPEQITKFKKAQKKKSRKKRVSKTQK